MIRTLVSGGYGNAGREICRLLQHSGEFQVLVGGRNEEKAQQFIKETGWNSTYPTPEFRFCDTASSTSLDYVLWECQLLVVASSSMDHIAIILEACIRNRVHYADIMLSSQKKWEILFSYREQFSQHKLIALPDGGFHPGLPALMVRYMANKYGEINSAEVYSALRVPWQHLQISPSTRHEFVKEMEDFRPLVYKQGKWEGSTWNPPIRRVLFEDPIGEIRCMAMLLQEMHQLPVSYPDIQYCGFYISGFNPVTDNLILPLLYLFRNYQWINKQLYMLFWFSLKRFSKAPYLVDLRCEIRTSFQKKSILSLRHRDSYFMTAVPCVGTLLSVFRDPRSHVGLKAQSWAADPIFVLNYARKWGIELKEKVELLDQ